MRRSIFLIIVAKLLRTQLETVALDTPYSAVRLARVLPS